tara:strand:- start:7261 stop:7404 length:144 start_codon:yes stop_codon:yes gene_type:complete
MGNLGVTEGSSSQSELSIIDRVVEGAIICTDQWVAIVPVKQQSQGRK